MRQPMRNMTMPTRSMMAKPGRRRNWSWGFMGGGDFGLAISECGLFSGGGEDEDEDEDEEEDE